MQDSMTQTGYPVTFELDYPENPGRFSILIRWLLAIPHLLVLYVLGILAMAVVFIAFWAILFTARYPTSLFRFVGGVYRWQNNAYAYSLFHASPYPPFTLEEGKYPHLRYDVEMQERYSRWLPFVKWLLAIPHMIVLAFLGLLAQLVFLFCVVAVVVTGRFPRGAFGFLYGVGRWSARVNAYLLLQTDRYPPFSMS